jgi:peptidyl-prolyl cis-trans isomerase B (cyclophilin B)
MKKMLLGVLLGLVMMLSACADDTPSNNIVEDENWMTRPVVTISVKNYGDMTLILYPNIAPITVNNFINYIANGDYDGSTFHRVIENFMVQGGIVDETVCPIYGEFISNGFENPLLHTRGVLAMARTMVSNNTQTSQFFIMHQDEPYLDGDYTTFGKLQTGYDVLDMIASQTTDANDAPLQEIVIEEITIDLDGYVLQEVDCFE